MCCSLCEKCCSMHLGLPLSGSSFNFTSPERGPEPWVYAAQPLDSFFPADTTFHYLFAHSQNFMRAGPTILFTALVC